MAATTRPSIAIIGSALYGNQGAAAMLLTSIDEVSREYPAAKFGLLSLYPKIERQKNTLKNLEIYDARTLYLALVIIPLCLLWRLLPFMRKLISKNKSVELLAGADVILDQGGITFVDGRAVFLIYNIATILPGLFLGKKIIKISQAIGPFNSPINRWTAKFFLPKMYHILARGQQTAEHLKSLKLTNYSVAADYSFLLKTTPADRQKVDKLFKTRALSGKNKLVGLSPSSVVSKKCSELGLDYPKIITELINYLTVQGHTVVVIPHSLRLDGRKHNNDLPLAEAIFNRLKKDSSAQLIKELEAPAQLRYAISQCDIFIASRFHAMVSSLASGVPPVVIGWSHKYQEVIDMFKINTPAIGYDQLNLKNLQATVSNVQKNRTRISDQLAKNLPTVTDSAKNNTRFIVRAIEED